jgi:hypothetical protein
MKKFYIASSFSNIETVRYVSRQLKNKGYMQAYDWTENEKTSSLEDLRTIGQAEREAVMEADFLIVLFPAGKGSHIELGIALGHGVKVYLYSADGEINNLETTSTFYHLPEMEKVIGTVEELLEIVG